MLVWGDGFADYADIKCHFDVFKVFGLRTILSQSQCTAARVFYMGNVVIVLIS